ncbi:hypothetical protein CgunFtcFv8_022231 [Champsocephalus gunnari]|uniref:Uncharacterized protein n=1 Tax=Champsocephalus gunnari TaxID=52237 RepID=A0AAN8DPA3_CHAGU|nr:hypothetical protein CgunFtcFv8_022231 [Champsocephalus gunnari]
MFGAVVTVRDDISEIDVIGYSIIQSRRFKSKKTVLHYASLLRRLTHGKSCLLTEDFQSLLTKLLGAQNHQ